jgi:outer membrane protein assembly factor BamD
VPLELNFLQVLVHRIDLHIFVETCKGDGQDPVAGAHVKERCATLNSREEEESIVEQITDDCFHRLLAREVDALVPAVQFQNVKVELVDDCGAAWYPKVIQTPSYELSSVHVNEISIYDILLLYYLFMSSMSSTFSISFMRKTFLIFVILPLLFVSCSSKVTKKPEAPGVLYVEGMELMNKKKYDKAIEKFSAVKENYPFDPIADVAAVKLGDAYYAKKEYLLAGGVYADFITSHPDDDNVPYVLWQLADCYDKESLSMDRDQSNVLKAIERLTFLKNRYPSSPYAAKADERLRDLMQKLADRELYVGDFYYRTGRFNAATLRLEYFLSRYPGAKGTDKALYLLAASYRELENNEKSQYYAAKLVGDFPGSTWTTTRAKEAAAAKLKAEKQAATASSKAVKPKQGESVSFMPTSASAPKQSEAVSFMPSGAPAGKEPAQAALEGKEPAQTPPAERVTVRFPESEEPVRRSRIELRPPKDLLLTQVQPGAGSATGASSKAEERPADATAKAEEKPAEGTSKPGDKGKGFGFFTEKKPVDIVADIMEGLEKGKIIVFKGNVVAKQEDLQIFSETMTAYLNEESNEIDKVEAKGNVKIVKAERTATCEEALFENAKGEITLKGNVVVYSGPDRLAGDTVIYYLNEDRVSVEGEKDKRARITVHPK